MEIMDTKVCPRCGRRLFADMDTCYDCLFVFREAQEGVPEDDEEACLTEVVPPEAYPEEADATWCPPEEGQAERFCIHLATDVVDVRLPLTECGLLVGRGSACDVVLHAVSVSRRHVRIEPAPGGAVVRDQGSKNRAVLRGQRVEGSARLLPGDTLTVCGSSLTLERVPPHG